VGSWVSVMIAAAALNVFAGASTHWNDHRPTRAVHSAGPIDDAIDYMECLLNMLMGIPCEHPEHEDLGEPLPEPEDPPA